MTSNVKNEPVVGAFNEVDGSQIWAVMSRDERHARSYAERHGIRKYYTDAQKLIDDPDVNAIYVNIELKLKKHVVRNMRKFQMRYFKTRYSVHFFKARH